MSLAKSLRARRPKDIPLRDARGGAAAEHAYILGYQDALRDILSDETYYGVNLSPGQFTAVKLAVTFNQ